MSTKLIQLTPDQVAELQQAQRILHDLLPEFDDMESCGIDCQGARAIHLQNSVEIQEMLSRFSTFQPQGPGVAP